MLSECVLTIINESLLNHQDYVVLSLGRGEIIQEGARGELPGQSFIMEFLPNDTLTIEHPRYEETETALWEMDLKRSFFTITYKNGERRKYTVYKVNDDNFLAVVESPGKKTDWVRVDIFSRLSESEQERPRTGLRFLDPETTRQLVPAPRQSEVMPQEESDRPSRLDLRRLGSSLTHPYHQSVVVEYAVPILEDLTIVDFEH